MAAEYFDNPTQGRKDLDESIPVKEQVMFKFELNQLVNIVISDEFGEVKGRAEYATHENSYFVHYKAGDGRAMSTWFDESDLTAVEDEHYLGCAVYAGRELPDGAIVEE